MLAQAASPPRSSPDLNPPTLSGVRALIVKLMETDTETGFVSIHAFCGSRREKTLRAFKQGAVQVLVGTDVASR